MAPPFASEAAEGCDGTHEGVSFQGMQVDVFSDSHGRWFPGSVSEVLSPGLLRISFEVDGTQHRKALPPCSAQIRYARERGQDSDGQPTKAGPLGSEAWHFTARCAPCIRRAAVYRVMRALSGIFKDDGEHAPHLSEEEIEAASSAVREISYAVRRGDEAAMMATMSHTEDSDKDVRMCAMIALRPAVQQGHRRSFDLVKERLRDSSHTVRVAAISSLRVLAERGVDDAVEAMVSCCRDSSEAVRWSALQPLQTVLAKNEREDAVNAALDQVEDAQPDVSKAAGEALQASTQRGNRRVIESLAKLLEHDESHVRRSAALGLEPAMKMQDRCAVEAVLKVRDSQCVGVQTAAIHALQPAAATGERDCILALVSCIEDERRTVRSAAESALRLAVENMHECAVSPLSKLCEEHPDPKVRGSAVRALKPCAWKCEAPVLERMRKCLQDADRDVREAAADALEGTEDRCL